MTGTHDGIDTWKLFSLSITQLSADFSPFVMPFQTLPKMLAIRLPRPEKNPSRVFHLS